MYALPLECGVSDPEAARFENLGRHGGCPSQVNDSARTRLDYFAVSG